MGTPSKALSSGQMRCIYAVARSGGMDTEALHAMVESMTGKDSIRQLTGMEAKNVIDRLKRLTGQEDTAPPNRATAAQAAKIYALARELGWSDDPSRLRAFLEQRFRVSHPTFLTSRGAYNCIEAMKAMAAGGRGERRGVGHGRVDGQSDR